MKILKIHTAMNTTQVTTSRGVSVDTSMPSGYNVLIDGAFEDKLAVSYPFVVTPERSALLTVWGIGDFGAEAHVKIFKVVSSAGSSGFGTSGCTKTYDPGTESTVLYEQEMCNEKLDACNFTKVLTLPGTYLVKLFDDADDGVPVFTHGVKVTNEPLAGLPKHLPRKYVVGGE